MTTQLQNLESSDLQDAVLDVETTKKAWSTPQVDVLLVEETRSQSSANSTESTFLS